MHYLLLYLFADINNPLSHPHSLHHKDSLLKLMNVPRELKIPFEDLEYDAKMIGEGK